MQVIRAEILGFCFGVRRAVEIAQKALNEKSGETVFTLGPLIHNENVLKDFEKKGLKIIQSDEIDSLNKNSVVIIRAHGTSPEIQEKLMRSKAKVIDATCPRVKNSQNIVKELSEKKDIVIFTGDKNHGEVKSIEGYGKNNFVLVQNAQEAEEFCLKTEKNEDSEVLLLSQTTFSNSEFKKIAEIIQKKFKNTEIKNTICPATRERQESLIDLCKKCEAVIVIGGKNSANTNRLFEIASKNCKKAAFIQDENGIKPDFFADFKTVGLTAGASTPDILIERVENLLKNEKVK